MSQGRVNRILKTPANYPRKNHNGLTRMGERERRGHELETCKGTRRGAVHRVNPPGTGGFAKKLLRRAVREGQTSNIE